MDPTPEHPAIYHDAHRPPPGTWLVLAGLLLYLSEFVGMALAGGYPANEPGTPLDQVADAYAGLSDGSGLLVGWMALALTGRILIVVGLRRVVGRTPLMDWAVAVMAVSVAVEVVSVAATAAAARLVDDDGDPAAVLAADHLAWSLGSGVSTAGGLSAMLAAIGLWRSRRFGLVLPLTGTVLGAVMLLGGLLSGAPSTYPVGSALSVGVLGWFVWVLWIGVLLARRVPRSTS